MLLEGRKKKTQTHKLLIAESESYKYCVQQTMLLHNLLRYILMVLEITYFKIGCLKKDNKIKKRR